MLIVLLVTLLIGAAGLSVTSWYIMLVVGNLHQDHVIIPALGFTDVFGALLWPSVLIFVLSLVVQVVFRSGD